VFLKPWNRGFVRGSKGICPSKNTAGSLVLHFRSLTFATIFIPQSRNLSNHVPSSISFLCREYFKKSGVVIIARGRNVECSRIAEFVSSGELPNRPAAIGQGHSVSGIRVVAESVPKGSTKSYTTGFTSQEVPCLNWSRGLLQNAPKRSFADFPGGQDVR
jgi:hypothetical protein